MSKNISTQIKSLQKVRLLLFSVCWMIGSYVPLTGQTEYNIRIEQIEEDENEICYAVQIQGKDKSWFLGGQNYRLYYDASVLQFQSGTSLLNETYQEFNLVQHIENADASAAQGCLHFNKNMSFLNYSIEKLNNDVQGLLVPTDQEWVGTSYLCFQKKSDQEPTIIWGREELTYQYSTAFVEMAEWVSPTLTKAVIGHIYIDVGIPCESSNNIDTSLKLKARAFLQGPYNSETGLMEDHLRRENLIPLKEPYSKLNRSSGDSSVHNNQQSIEPDLLFIEGEKAILDWVLLELRSPEDSALVLESRAALLLRDGRIVDAQNNEYISFDQPLGNYFLAIRHRNHMGCMTARAHYFGSINENTNQIDFTNPSLAVYGQESRIKIEEVMCMWSGNADANLYLIANGAGMALPDGDKIFFDVITSEFNKEYNFNFTLSGYYNSDLNMDGEVLYQGQKNDRDLILMNILSHKGNVNFFTNFYFKEQLP